MASTLSEELASVAARLVIEEGMEYGPAKRRAARALGHVRPTELPSNEAVEQEVRTSLALFHADTQPGELAALRRLALQWMARLSEFRPHLAGAAWRGTATRLSSLHIDLFCDDPKSAEIALINQQVRYDSGSTAARGHAAEDVHVLSFAWPCPELGEAVTIHLAVRDLDELRGALKPDAQGRTQRGSETALRRLLETES
jgi:hypothetical protein